VPRVLVVGSANVDFTIAVPRLPRSGETVSDGTLSRSHGGKGANQAVAARRLGAEVRFIACVGDDSTGHEIRAVLEREGIDPGGVTMEGAAPTGTALIVVDGDGRNQIAVAPGANRLLSVELVGARREDFDWAEVVICQLETPLATVAWALNQARDHGALTILNPAPVPDDPLDPLWPLIDYLTPNAGEAERLSGTAVSDRESTVKAAELLRARGVGAAIVTLGADGVLACATEGVVYAPAFQVKAIDTTAAGDAFNGALGVALAERRLLPEALALSNAAAGLACTRRGAQTSLPSRAEVDQLLRRQG